MTTRSQLLMLVGLVALANTPVRAQDASALGQRGYIGVNGLYQTTETIFSDTVDLDVYQEAGTVTVTHPSGTGPAFDVTAGGPIGRHVGLSYGFVYYRRADPGAVQGLVPHPFFFDRHRAVPGTSDLEREERTFHLSVLGLLPMTRRFQAIVFGGPSYFWVRQDTVTDIAFSESYPYDEATFTGATVTRRQTRGWGYNVGVDVSYYFADHAGIGALVRYAPAMLDLPSATGTVEIEAGGLQAGGGVRFRF